MSATGRHFLQFVAHGMQRGWDSAAADGLRQARNVEALEEAWLKHLRETKGMTIIQLAQMKNGGGNATPTSTGTVVRLTVPPTQPTAATPVVRGVSGTPEEDGPALRPAVPNQPVPVQLGPPQWIPAPPSSPQQ